MNLCPFFDLSCPYLSLPSGKCLLDNPVLECDDYYAIMGEEEEE